MIKPDTRILVGGALAIGLALGAGTTAVVGDSDSPVHVVAKTPRAKVDDTAHGKALVAARAKLKPGAKVTDLKTENWVAPGRGVTVGVSLPKGAQPGRPVLTGASVVSFSEPRLTCRDDADAMWCEITATNTSSAPQRLTALVEYEVAP